MPQKGSKTPAKSPARPKPEVMEPISDRVSGEVSAKPTVIPGFPIKTYTDAEMARRPDIPWLVPIPEDAPPGAASAETLLPPALWEWLKRRFVPPR